MHIGLRICVAAAGLVWAASPASAQLPLSSPFEKPADLMREAFASPYGRAMAAEFTAVLSKSADPACLRAKKLDSARLAQRGETFIATWAARSLERLASFINIAIYDAAFAKSAGVGAEGELARLKANADVKRYVAIERPRQLATTLDWTFEQFSRYALISRIKIGPVSPLATGNQTLLDANPTDKVEVAIEKFLETNDSPQLRRYVELAEQQAAALAASFDTEHTRNGLGPGTLFAGAEKDLAEICIERRQ